ncbi:MAG TPA: outer-membrane lipoprotein carrier protein LolA [Woeseiaceae bacterium]|nr:outer-membrane lipoprotein carrier protein LolA [Woeseiaceae bacterium]
MNIRQGTTCALLALAAAVVVSAQENELAWTMERAVKQLDRQGSDFESVLADVDVDLFGGDSEPVQIKGGRIYINDKGEFRLNAESPVQRTILLDGSTVHHYDPQAKLVKQYSLSKHKDRLEAFVPLGFSTTGKDLDNDFLVTFIGEDAVGDRRTLGLELTPKNDKMRAVVSRIQIWVDESSWLPARQIITQSSGGQVLTVTYSGTARNLDLNRELFDDNWPKGTEKERM